MTPPSGHAGAASRLAAYVVDVTALSALFSAGVAVAALLARIVVGVRLDLGDDRDLAGVGLALWWVAYFSVPWALVGQTPGMALLGIRVERPGGDPVTWRPAILRSLALALTVLLFGVGFLGILFQRERRALHDLLAGTSVVYA